MIGLRVVWLGVVGVEKWETWVHLQCPASVQDDIDRSASLPRSRAAVGIVDGSSQCEETLLG